MLGPTCSQLHLSLICPTAQHLYEKSMVIFLRPLILSKFQYAVVGLFEACGVIRSGSVYGWFIVFAALHDQSSLLDVNRSWFPGRAGIKCMGPIVYVYARWQLPVLPAGTERCAPCTAFRSRFSWLYHKALFTQETERDTCKTSLAHLWDALLICEIWTLCLGMGSKKYQMYLYDCLLYWKVTLGSKQIQF